MMSFEPIKKNPTKGTKKIEKPGAMNPFKGHKKLKRKLDPEEIRDGTRGRGRPSLLAMNEDLIYSIAEAVREGLFYTDAAAMYGISRMSINAWMTKGVRDEENELDTPEARFAIEVKKARALSTLDSVRNIRRAGQNPAFWMSEAWFLERTQPEQFGKQDRQTVELKGKLGLGVVTANIEGDPTELKESAEDGLSTILSGLIAGRTEDSSE
jgi:hypothetical protein